MNTTTDAGTGGRGTLRAATVLSAGLLVCGASLFASAAHAAVVAVPENGEPGRLVLLSDPYPAEFLDLEPGVQRHWQVTATIEGATSASLVLELRKAGELVDHPAGLVVSIERCDTTWDGVSEDDPRCDAGRALVTRSAPADDAPAGPVFDLDGVDADGTHLLVTLSLDDADPADESLMGLTGDVGLGLTAAAADPGTPTDPGVPADPGVPNPPVALPVTGAEPLGLVLAALGAIGLGATALVARARRPPSTWTVQSEGAAQLASTATVGRATGTTTGTDRR